MQNTLKNPCQKQSNMELEKAIQAITAFQGESLTSTISEIEREIIGLNAKESAEYCTQRDINDAFIDSSLLVKSLAGQINVLIHTAGILHSLKGILKENEVIESVSLGAGNTGKKFDLVTNLQVAEFKFIDWQGGAESIRQNGIFKDFYDLAEFDTPKRKVLYVVGTYYPIKFLSGGRALRSVLSKQPKIMDAIKRNYGESIVKVKDYYELQRGNVDIEDISPHIGRA